MNTPPLSLEDVVQMTEQHGEGWAVGHALRLQALIREIGVGATSPPPSVQGGGQRVPP
jgi:hypothetical protein